MLRKFPGKGFQKLLNFQKANHSSENSGNSGRKNGTEIPGKEISENLGIPRELSSFPEIPENAVPLVTGNFRKFKPEFFIQWKAAVGWCLDDTIAEIRLEIERTFLVIRSPKP